MAEYLKETTTEWNAEFRVPQHIYILNDKSRLIGYIKERTSNLIPLSGIRFDQKGRKFTVLKEEVVKRLLELG